MDRISFIIPTLNAELQLDSCLKSIRHQHYPQNFIEIIISDGGSTDKTLKIAQKYKSKIIKNPLKTAEAGKAVGVQKASGQYIAFIDSDNILPNKNWLNTMLKPFINKKVQISEPWSFTYRKKAGFVERYSSLIGANDPYAFVCGITDRKNYITNKWTSLKIDQTEYKDFFIAKLKSNTNIPTIGANGTIFRTSFLKKLNIDKYLFDIDIIQQYLDKYQYLYIAKVKIGIIHTFCENSISKFIRKQTRRIVDYYIYNDLRQFKWTVSNFKCIPKFLLYTFLFIPPFFDSLRGFYKKPDMAWFFHPIACYLTLLIYINFTIKKKLNILSPIQRHSWKQ